jgi:hypothetical protein
MINTELINKRILASGKTKKELASMMGMSPSSFYRKCSGKVSFRVSEFMLLCNLIHATKDEINAII